jgi:hypothetical protein
MIVDLLQLNTLYKKMIVGLVIGFCALVVVYGALVHTTVSHVVSRKTLEASIADMSGSVSSLEGQYMQKVSTLTIDEAHQLGFVDAHVALFVSLHPEGPVLSLNTSQ